VLLLCYSLHLAINDVAEERVYHVVWYEIFFVNFWVIILCPVFIH